MAKKLVSVLHLPPLPGSPRCQMGRQEIWDRAKKEASMYCQAGIPSLILENHGDAPFYPGPNPSHVIAFMAVLADRIANEFSCEVGINVLRNDGQGALAAAAASGANFIRINLLSGVAATDQGLISGQGHELLRERKNIDAKTQIWADVNVKFSTQLHQPGIAALARTTRQRSLADALIVTGAATGAAANCEEVSEAKSAVGDCPVFVGSGVDYQTVADILTVCDGVIVGSDLKVDGYVENDIDLRRLDRFVEAFAKGCARR